MTLTHLESTATRLLRQVVGGPWFLATCFLLAGVSSLFAAYPVTVVAVPAALLAPQRWRQVAWACALGSATGATALVATLHHLGWSTVYAHFPELARNASWSNAVQWVQDHGWLALCAIAASPLPQTPALLAYSIVHPQLPTVFFAIGLGKLLKYGFVCWLASRFPDHMAPGLLSLLHHRWHRRRSGRT